MSSKVSGLLFILMASKYSNMELGVGILVALLEEWMSLWIMTNTPPLGGWLMYIAFV